MAWLGPALSGYAGTALKKKQAKGSSGSSTKDINKAVKGAVKSPSGAANAAIGMAQPGEYRRGGKVRKTGMARVEKGERVLTRKQQKRMGRRRQSSKR
jgi:hypothetical protein